MKKEKKQEVDFTPYTNIIDGKNCNCFIAPNGEFYRVRETTSIEMPGEYKYRHVEWAEEFVHSIPELQERFLVLKERKESNPDFRRTYTAYDFLLTDCGWIAYTTWLERNRQTLESKYHYGCLPIVCKQTMEYTPLQIETIKGLIQQNNALPGVGFLDRIRWSGDFAATWYQENLLENDKKR